jgi:hypothetical protein
MADEKAKVLSTSTPSPKKKDVRLHLTQPSLAGSSNLFPPLTLQTGAVAYAVRHPHPIESIASVRIKDVVSGYDHVMAIAGSPSQSTAKTPNARKNTESCTRGDVVTSASSAMATGDTTASRRRLRLCARGRSGRCSVAPTTPSRSLVLPPLCPKRSRRKDTGEVYAWGGGSHGQLGLGDREKALVPKPVSSLRRNHVLQVFNKRPHPCLLTLKVACGGTHTLVLTSKRLPDTTNPPQVRARFSRGGQTLSASWGWGMRRTRRRLRV